MPSNKRLQPPIKGNITSSPDFICNEDHLHSHLPLAAPQQPAADGSSVVFACTNFKPCVTADAELPPQNLSSSRSRNTQRFANRKRAVRVRSESRPISALYDIICKEKGLDIATTTTNDEDSSPSHSHDEEKANANTHHLHSSRSRRSHSRSVSRQTKSSVASSNNSNMSGGLGNNSSGGDHPQHRSALQQKKRNDKYSPNSIFINDLSDDDEDDIEGGCSRKNYRLRNTHKKGNLLLDELQNTKSSSLPPGLVNHNSHDSLSDISRKSNLIKSSNGSNAKTTSNANNHATQLSQLSSNPSLLSSNTNTNTTLSVEPIHLHLSSSSPQDTGAGTNNFTTTSATSNQLEQQDQQLQQQHQSLASPKTDRYSRKHRRLRDDKPRRHTDGAIKLFPSELNDFDIDDKHQRHNNDNDDDDYIHDDGNHHHREQQQQQVVADDNGYSDIDDDDQQYHPSQYHDLNGAGHDFHTSSANAAANAKRYITRSQRVQQQQQQTATTNDSRSSPAIRSSPALQQQQNDLNPTTTTTTTNKTTQITNPSSSSDLSDLKKTVEINGHTIKTNGEDKEQEQQQEQEVVEEKEDEMTNNSGKKSKTTTTATTATTKTTNPKDLKINIPLTSDDATLTTATAAAATTTTKTVDASSCSSVVTDKKKDEENKQQRFTSPTSPKPLHHSQHNARRVSPSSTCSDNPKHTSGSETEHHKMSSTNSSPTHRGNKKLIPSMSVSMKQNLSETQCTASRSNSIRSNTNSPKSPKQMKTQTNSSTECTVKITASPKVKTKSSQLQKSAQQLDDDGIDADFLEIHDLPDENGITLTRPRCSTMYTDSDKSKSSLSNGGGQNDKLLDISPVHKSRTSNRSPRRNEERDKSSKRKSNLNRSLNEEATPDGDDSAMRRRRRREMGMSRPLVPNDDASLKALISPHKTRVPSPTKPAIRNDLSYHMEMARRGLDLATTSERRRAQTASPKNIKESPSPKSSNAPARVSKRSDTVAIGELRKERSSEVNRKLNERTRTGLEEIMKIVENVSDSTSPNPSSAINDLNQTMNRLRASQEREKEKETAAAAAAAPSESLNLPATNGEEQQRRPSPVKHATFVQEERIYYEPDPLEHIDNSNGGMLRSMRMLKAKSIERETAASEPAKLSPILRRKSTDCPPNSLTQGSSTSTATNHIVSILKKKDHLSAGESSSASSNASPVTFSSNVMDTPSKQKRAGILKKRSSLDESRYYSRSHSPDERSILIKSARRNSLEEVANGSSSSSSAQGAGHHGILKQSSYDSSKSDGCPSATREPLQPHSILKKKDSTSTPSDGGDHAPKHVSISQAVILAAAELSAAVETGDKFPNDDNYTPNNEEYDIKPILKLDSSTGDESVKPPKPILKKKSSGDSDEHEIKPILKTSRKSSREEFEFGPYSDSESQQQEPAVKPILKTDSPSKRRSLGEPDSGNLEGEHRETLSPFQLKRRTRSLERHDQAPVIDLAAALNAIATSQALPSELVSSLTNTTAGSSNISVAERIKSVEKFLANQSGQRSSMAENPSTSAVNTSWESPLQNDPNCSSNATSGSVKILKPSVIRRDLYKDRFKTQPVTSDEKNFFKTNVSSVNDSLPTGSAFKPAQSLEGLGFAHLSSHGNQSPNAPPSAFTLTRSFTQPLSSSIHSPPQSSSSFKAGLPVPVPRKSPPRSNLLTSQQDSSIAHNLTLSFTGDSGLSCNNSNSERIFEMSSLEQDVDMVTGENQEPKTPLNKDSSEASSASSSSSSGGVVRTNSVRARANMFQQMQEKTNNGGAALNREERTSPKRVPRRLSPSPAVNTDEPKTPNNPPLNPDDEIEPSSLPVSERLRFFSSLSEVGKRNSCSFTRSPPFNSIERSSSVSSYHYYMATTPRSSTSLSSASVTPTPMECPLPIFIESPTILRKNSSTSTAAAQENETSNVDTAHDLTDSRFAIKADIVKTSPFLQATKQALPIPGHVAETETTPTSTLTPTMKRIKLKTIGKLMLPSTFLNNDRNNNNSKESSATNNKESSSESNGENEHSGPPKKIGKIKSPFIENCNQKQQKQMQVNSKCMKFDYNNKTQNSLTALTSLENSNDHHSMDLSTLTNGMTNGCSVGQRKYQNTSLQINGHHHSEDFSTDSGKENVDTSLQEQTTPVVEIRRKFTRKANTSQSFNTSTGSGMTRSLTPRSASLNGPHSSPQVDDKYAKYFGVNNSTNKSTKSNQAAPPLPKQPPPSSSTTTTSSPQDQFGHHTESTNQQPQVMAINRNVRLWNSTARGVKRMASVINKFEDIIVTEKELKLASKEFDSLLHNDSILKHSSKEFEKIFSSIV